MEYSYEIEALQQGAFTTVLLEGLGIQGQCAAVERLNQYLKFCVPELVRQHKNARQTPYIIAEPVNKSHLILVPRYATLTDIATLKNDAYQAEVTKNLELAEQLWIRVLAAASGTDMDAIKAIKRIERSRWEHQEPTSLSPNSTIETSNRGTHTTPTNKSVTPDEESDNRLQTFQFEVVTVDAQGSITSRHNCEAKYFVEDLRNGVTLDMVQISGGTFTMGSPNQEAYDSEKPQHKVTVQPFFMGKYLVTQAQWQAVAALPRVKRDLKPDPSNFKGDRRLVEQVSWYDAVEFCARLSIKTGREYRLPSEAEWEYACRAGTITPFYFGETITSELANYDASKTYASEPKGQYRQQTIDVGSFPPNAFGLYDMHGNIWEWCQDTWHNNYNGAPTGGSAWINDTDNDNDNSHTIRGGSWGNNPTDCRSASRIISVLNQEYIFNLCASASLHD